MVVLVSVALCSIEMSKRKAISIEDKAHIIFRLDNGELNKDIAKDFGVPHSTISKIKKHREKFLTSFDEEKLKRKKVRNSRYNDVEEALLAWLRIRSSKNVPISGPILQKQANRFAEELGKSNFQCSSSWIQRFRNRHNIVVGKISEKAASIPVDVSVPWLDSVRASSFKGIKHLPVY